MLIIFVLKLVISSIMALVNLIVTQPTSVRDCIGFCILYRIPLVLCMIRSIIACQKDGKDDIMEPIQRYRCCKLALGVYGVRRRTSTISNCEKSCTRWEAELLAEAALTRRSFMGNLSKNLSGSTRLWLVV